MRLDYTHQIRSGTGFSLRYSAGPAAWGGDASPRHAVTNGAYVAVDSGIHGPIGRRVQQRADGSISITMSTEEHDPAWFERVFRRPPSSLAWGDPLLQELHQRFPGLWSLTDGGLFPGLVTSIVGQSISIASAMATQRRLALSFSAPVTIDGRELIPLPAAGRLAEASVELIRASGVTWKRAEALKVIAREEANGNLPAENADAETIAKELRTLPLVGPWTAASALLWGLGDPDAYPSGDVALLRAARLAYDNDGMTMKDLDRLAEGWRPYRAIAARLLWTALLGPAW